MTKGSGEHAELEQTSEELGGILGRLFPELDQEVKKVLEPIGFEAFPFKIGWYNELVGPRFQLDYTDDTVALVVISGPDTFEKCVLPYVRTQLAIDEEFYCRNPLDDSMKCVFKGLVNTLISAGYEVDAFHDFDLYPSRKPKVLVQTAAHVAGCVEYYHRDRILAKEPSWCKDWKLFGVAIHPLYGGWFAIRGVVILKNISANPDKDILKPQRPITDVAEDVIANLLEEFGSNWRTNKWRDIIPRKSSTKYSQGFIDYLAADPDQRWDLVKSILTQ